jgi:hypothetical protein
MQLQFTPEQRDLIYAGKKTQHRILADGPCPYRTGHAYRVRVSGDGEPRVPITVLSVTPAQLRDATLADVVREGAEPTQRDRLKDYRSNWIAEHGGDLEQDVYVLTIAPFDRRDRTRWMKRGTPRLVICKNVIACELRGRQAPVYCNRAFAVGQERCACGAKPPSDSDDDYGYTASHAGALDAGEALSDADLAQYAWHAAKEGELLRDMPARESIAKSIDGIATLREAMTEMKGRNRDRVRLMEKKLGSIEREIEKMAAELPSAIGV